MTRLRSSGSPFRGAEQGAVASLEGVHSSAARSCHHLEAWVGALSQDLTVPMEPPTKRCFTLMVLNCVAFAVFFALT